MNVNTNVDMNVVMAWKNGMFVFNGTDLHTIMKQLGRWYDVDIEYQTTVNPGYHTIFPRTVTALRIFSVLEKTGGVHFKIDGKKIIVLP